MGTNQKIIVSWKNQRTIHSKRPLFLKFRSHLTVDGALMEVEICIQPILSIHRHLGPFDSLSLCCWIAPLTYGREEHVVQQEGDGHDDEHQTARAAASLQEFHRLLAEHPHGNRPPTKRSSCCRRHTNRQTTIYWAGCKQLHQTGDMQSIRPMFLIGQISTCSRSVPAFNRLLPPF